jgi:hypothetical protein
VFAHTVRLFTAWLAFTACMCCAIAASADDGALTFTSAAFVQPSGWPSVLGARRATEQLGPGVGFERWQLATAGGPLTVSIVRVDLKNPAVALMAVSRNDQILGPGEQLSTMADRHNAEAGINADYYDISGNGMPTNLVLENGAVQHAPNGRAALVIGDDRGIVMGPVSWHVRLATASGAGVTIGVVNDWSAQTQLMLFTQHFGLPGPANADAELLLSPAADGSSGYQVTRAVSDQPTFVPLRPDELGVAARGQAAVDLLQTFHQGDNVTLTQQWDPAMPGPREGVGGGPLLLRAGAPYDDPDAPSPEERDVRYPLTGAGTSPDGSTLWLVTIDGRAPGRSVGATRPMLGSLFAALGASDAMAFDSGGSTEMVVRRLGDTHVTVANVPSDGRERSIADGLLVINAAAPGPPDRMVVRAAAPAVLVGSHMTIVPESIDANDQPVAAGTAVRYTATPSDVASIDGAGTLTALHPGTVTVTADAGGARGEVRVSVVDRVSTLSIGRLERAYLPGVPVPLSVVAMTREGATIAIDRDAVRWSATGDGGELDARGTFITAAKPSKSTVIARAGGARAESTLFVGAHELSLQHVLSPGDGPAFWHLERVPKDLAASLDSSPARDGSPALHLSYDFGGFTGSRAAIAQSEIRLPGEPLVLSIDVYGDRSGAWLRAGYRNGDGVNDSLTLARHVDWEGWRTVRVSVPVQARWPIVWTKIYVVAPPSEKGAGDLWLRNLAAWYPGPAGATDVAICR